MHQLSGFNKKIMISQIKQRYWKGMWVGGKGVTQAGRQRVSLESADNEEVVELPTNRFQTSLAFVFLVGFASPRNVRTWAEQCAARLALSVKPGWFFYPSHSSCSNHTSTSLATKINSKQNCARRCAFGKQQPWAWFGQVFMLRSVLVVIFRHFRVLPEALYNLNNSVALWFFFLFPLLFWPVLPDGRHQGWLFITPINIFLLYDRWRS